MNVGQTGLMWREVWRMQACLCFIGAFRSGRICTCTDDISTNNKGVMMMAEKRKKLDLKNCRRLRKQNKDRYTRKAQNPT